MKNITRLLSEDHKPLAFSKKATKKNHANHLLLKQTHAE